MKLQIGSIKMNKTLNYLVPSLLQYGPEFREKFNSVSKLGIGIGDMVMINRNIQLERHIFVLIDSKVYTKRFAEFIKYMREQEFFEDDYVYDDLNFGRMHMVVIKLPAKYSRTIDKFKLGKYSEMYESTDIDKFFIDKGDIQSVLIKDHNYKLEFVNKINDRFNSTITEQDWEGELEFPVDLEEEIFNYKKDGKDT